MSLGSWVRIADKSIVWKIAPALIIYMSFASTLWAQDMTDTSNWSSVIKTLQIDAGLTGVGGVVLKDNEIIAQAVAGEKRLKSELLIESDERWHIGSVTKSMTATMIARLVEKETLNWDDRVEAILGSKTIHPQWRDVTFRGLLTHRSGVKPNFSLFTNIFQPETQEETLIARKKQVRKILKKKPHLKVGSTFQYSNVGYTIAAHLAEVKTGQSWEDLMRQEVFEPLNLNSAGFGPPKSQDGQASAWGHKGNSPADPDKIADNSPIMGPAGNIHMTLQDLAKFGQAHIDGLAGRSDYLSKTTFETLHTPFLQSYAMGWVEPETSLFDGVKVFWHNGSNTFWYALLYVLPDENMVYALATNSGKISEADKAFADAMQMHFNSLRDKEE